MKKLLFCLIVLLMMGIGGQAFADTTGIPSAWAEEAIAEAISVGLLTPLVPEELRGNYQQPLTRAELASMVVALAQEKADMFISSYLHMSDDALRQVSPFTDTTDPAPLAANQLGIMTGTSETTFSPDAQVTREQLATTLLRLMDYLGQNVANSDTSGFADADTFSPWAIEAIQYVAASGLMEGVGENTFDASGSCTREQAIVIFLRLRNTTESYPASLEAPLSEVPELVITAGDITIGHEVCPSTWNGISIRRDVAMALYAESHSEEDVHYLPLGTSIEFTFLNDKPDPEVAYLYDFIVSIETFEATYTSPATTVYEPAFSIGSYALELEKNYATGYSSDSWHYLPRNSIRGFVLYCQWKDGSAHEYAFVIRTDFLETE